eukprot:2805924-Prymnesium_polylepis.1
MSGARRRPPPSQTRDHRERLAARPRPEPLPWRAAPQGWARAERGPLRHLDAAGVAVRWPARNKKADSSRILKT